MKEIYQKIFKNLEGRVYPVNDMIVLSGVNDLSEGHKALDQLIKDGRIKVELFNLDGMTAYLYRLAPRGFANLKLVVD